MRRASAARLVIVASLTIVACTNSTPAPPPTAPPATTTTTVTPAEDAATPGSSAATPDPGAGPPSPPGAPTSAAASCAQNSDCAWDDPCQPRRCVAASAAPPAAGCDKSVPPEGTCVCFDSRCTYRPAATRSPVSVEQPCESSPGCIMDAAAGTCTPGDDPDPPPPGTAGPRCRCDSREPRRCHYGWVDPVPCTAESDCWVSDDGFTPIARPRKLRRKRFRPCKDGERAPVCRDGTCAVVGYTC